MLIKNTADCKPFAAGDETTLRELLHPVETGMAIACSVAHATLEAGRSSRPHRLKRSSEIYYILKGSGRMHIGHQCEEVGPGQLVFIPPGAEQYIENTSQEPLSFLCIVDPAWREEDEEIL